jgi:hypothetical protein
MRFVHSLFLVFLGFLSSFAQNELVSDNYPFKNLFEWQGVGTIITSSDPDERQRDFNIWLLNTNGEVQWREKFYPKLANPYPIIGHNSSYIYFLDNLKPENHKINYHQINMSGSVKSTQFDLLPIVKKAGYNSTDDLNLVDIINTPGALVFQFEYMDKTQKKKDQFFIFLTHHNHRTYATKGISVGLDGLKDGIEGELRYAGSDAETIYFSRYIKRANEHTLEFLPFTAKGEEKLAQVFTIEGYTELNAGIEWINYRGEYHLNPAMSKKSYAQGGYYADKQFYFMGFDKDLSKFGILTFNEKGKQQVLKEVALTPSKKKKDTPRLALGELHAGFFVAFNLMEDNMAFYVVNSSAEKFAIFHNAYNLLRINPTLIKTGIQSGIFVHANNDNYFRLQTDDLGNTKVLSLEKQ